MEPVLELTQPIEDDKVLKVGATEPMISSLSLETHEETLNGDDSSEDDEENGSLTFSPTGIFDGNYLVN